LTRSRSIGSRSNSCRCTRAKRGGWIRSGALDLDLTATDARERLSGGGRRETAVAGGERRRSSPARPNPGFWASVWHAESTYAMCAKRRS
jgi:hypothetical protein